MGEIQVERERDGGDGAGGFETSVLHEEETSSAGEDRGSELNKKGIGERGIPAEDPNDNLG